VYAVIETGGKQLKVQVGEVVRVESLTAEPGADVVFDRVLMIGGKAGGETTVGAPSVEGATVKGSVVQHGRGPKINIYTYKRRQNSNRKRSGHRQNFTAVKIESIEV
jgi:large subunit ribosomal protein L21